MSIMDGTIDFAFLDSGTGGIPYMLALKEKSPRSRCVYLGDTGHFPYGQKTPEQVAECAGDSIERIMRQWNPRSLIIACNTISVTSLAQLRKRFPQLPIVGTVPAIKLAAKVTQNGRIGLLATNATVAHPYCKKLAADFAGGCRIFFRGDPALISFVEHRLFTATRQERLDAVKPSADFFSEKECDTIILGCTHFTHIEKDIREVFSCSGKKTVFVVDSRDGVANHALEILREKADGQPISVHAASICTADLPPDMSFFVTKLNGESDRSEYEILCRRFRIPFGGILR